MEIISLTKSLICLQVNYISLILIGTMNLLVVLSPVLYLYLTCLILRDRFAQTTVRLEAFTTDKAMDLAKLDEYLLDFNRIVDDLQKCDRFWSQILSSQYLLAISICSVLFLVCK